MKATLIQHRQPPNRAIKLLLATTRVVAEDFTPADLTPEKVRHYVDTLEKVWQLWAAEYSCNAGNLHIDTNIRNREQAFDPYLIWFKWGHQHGGVTLSTFKLESS